MIAADPELQLCTFHINQSRLRVFSASDYGNHQCDEAREVVVGQVVDDILEDVATQLVRQYDAVLGKVAKHAASKLDLPSAYEEDYDAPEHSTAKFEFDPTPRTMSIYTIDSEARTKEETIECVKYLVGDEDTIDSLLEALYCFGDLADDMCEDYPIYPFFTVSSPTHLRLLRKLILFHPNLFYEIHLNIEVVLFAHLENDIIFTSWQPCAEPHGQSIDVEAYLEEYLSALSEIYTDIDVILNFRAFFRDFDLLKDLVDEYGIYMHVDGCAFAEDLEGRGHHEFLRFHTLRSVGNPRPVVVDSLSREERLWLEERGCRGF